MILNGDDAEAITVHFFETDVLQFRLSRKCARITDQISIQQKYIVNCKKKIMKRKNTRITF